MDAKELKMKQAAAVERMLNLNTPAPAASFGGDQWSDQWKVLVYDRAGRDIISPLLNVAQLRRNGITLHMLVGSVRSKLAGFACAYRALCSFQHCTSSIRTGNLFQTCLPFTFADRRERTCSALPRIAGAHGASSLDLQGLTAQPP